MKPISDDLLRVRLVEDGLSPAEVEAHLASARRVAQLPSVAPRATASLIALAQAEARSMIAPHSSIWDRLQTAHFYLLLRAQLRLIQQEVWAASALVMALGVVVTLITYSPTQSMELMPFALLAPLVAAGGVAYLYGPALDPSLEIELATLTSPRQILLARLVLVFGFNLGLGLIGSALVSLANLDIPFWSLVSVWLAPMAFLSALAFSLTVLAVDSLIGITVSLVLWGGFIFKKLNTALPIPDLFSAAWLPWVWGFALGAVLLALWVGGKEEHWLKAS